MADVQQQLLIENKKKRDSDHLLNLQPSSQLDLLTTEDGTLLCYTILLTSH